ncbi:MAG: energy transducer TonB [Acidobacteriota bacterium]
MIPRVPLGAPLPEPMRQPLPEYPIKMRSQGIEGLVKVTVSIDESGVIDKVSVKEATSVEFESAVKEAISLWSFRPAKRGNEPCKSVVEFEFQFKYPMDE